MCIRDRAYSEKQSVFNSHDSITDSCSLNDSDFVNDRCAIKDDIKNKKLDQSAFNDALSNKVLNSSTDMPVEPASSSMSAYDSYNQSNIRDFLSKITMNQKDHSNNEVDTYEGELYLPNLIKEVGEEAREGEDGEGEA